MPDLSIDALLALMRTRRSIRKFSAAPLPLGTEQKLLEAAVWAPSGGNAQPWHFVLVRDEEAKKQLCSAAHAQRFVARAPLVIVVCADRERAHKAYGERGVDLYCLQDTAAAIQNLLLAAHAMGLGACWVGAFREDAVAKCLRLAAHLRPVAMLPVGIPEEQPAGPGRRPLSEVVHEHDPRS